jgi:hypothetical protein
MGAGDWRAGITNGRASRHRSSEETLRSFANRLMTLATSRSVPSVAPVDLWRLPLLPATFAQAVDEVERLIVAREPAYFITANLNYAMLTEREPRLAAVNRGAAFILADGMPLVWYSRWAGRPLPQRVAGSDLIYALCRRAAERGYRVFFLGGAPGVAEEAADRLCRLYPGLSIAGVEVPPFRPPTADEHARLIQRIRTAAPDLTCSASPWVSPRERFGCTRITRPSACRPACSWGPPSISWPAECPGRPAGSSGSAWNGPTVSGENHAACCRATWRTPGSWPGPGGGGRAGMTR